jgi:hypothetical protein
MSLWQLLVMIASAGPLAGALGKAKSLHFSWGWTFISVLAGLMLGFLIYVTLYNVGRFCFRIRVQRELGRRQAEMLAISLYTFCCLSAIVGGVLGWFCISVIYRNVG